MGFSDMSDFDETGSALTMSDDEDLCDVDAPAGPYMVETWMLFAQF